MRTRNRVSVPPGETMKNLQSLTLALSPAEIEILKRRKKVVEGEYVFPGNGRTGHYVEPKRAWARLLKRAGIKDLHIHDLRRSLASFMANAGADVTLIKGALNHKDIKTTINVYVRTAKSAELNARTKAHELMKELAKEEAAKVVPMKKQRGKDSRNDAFTD
ncbi:MAG TPA: tyrosine-type recombinase/integrase [Candidatus Obscuribacterales bacterium]